MTAIPKPLRGSLVFEREDRKRAIREAEQLAKRMAKVRDGWQCRWPGAHLCKGVVEVAHIFEDKKMGGDHGRLSVTAQLMTLCSFAHRRGPQSVHGKTFKVEPETPRGADGACAFYRRETLLHEWVCVGVEVAIGVLRKD